MTHAAVFDRAAALRRTVIAALSLPLCSRLRRPISVVSVAALLAASQAAPAGSEAGSVVTPGSVGAASAFLDSLAAMAHSTADARLASPAAPSPPYMQLWLCVGI